MTASSNWYLSRCFQFKPTVFYCKDETKNTVFSHKQLCTFICVALLHVLNEEAVFVVKCLILQCNWSMKTTAGWFLDLLLCNGSRAVFLLQVGSLLLHVSLYSLGVNDITSTCKSFWLAIQIRSRRNSTAQRHVVPFNSY